MPVSAVRPALSRSWPWARLSRPPSCCRTLQRPSGAWAVPSHCRAVRTAASVSGVAPCCSAKCWRSGAVRARVTSGALPTLLRGTRLAAGPVAAPLGSSSSPSLGLATGRVVVGTHCRPISPPPARADASGPIGPGASLPLPVPLLTPLLLPLVLPAPPCRPVARAAVRAPAR